MLYNIDPVVSKLEGLTLGEIFLLLSVYFEKDLDKSLRVLKEKYILSDCVDPIAKKFLGYNISTAGINLMTSILIKSDKSLPDNSSLEDLAKALKEIFPKGKKDGTSYYWAEGVPLIVRRLKLFMKKYGNTYTHEQILKASRKYVESFNGNYKFMRLLKYFIFKEELNAANEVEGTSELLTYIENEGQEEVLKNDWISSLT